MKRLRLSKHLRLLFFAAVLFPCAVLAVLAVRSIGREEAFLEKRLQGTLDAELVHVVSLIDNELRGVREELAATAPADTGADPRPALSGWKKASPFVGVPFILSADFRILWPTRTAYLAQIDLTFLNWNRDFVTDAKPTPIYQNVALLYKDRIVGPTEEETSGAGSRIDDRLDGKNKKAQPLAAPPLLLQRKTAERLPSAAEKEGGGDQAKASSGMENVRLEQQALAEFEQNDAARKRVYDEAAKKGQKAETRTVSPGTGAPPSRPQTAAERPESIFIAEPRRFSEITAGKNDGLIPRFIEDKLSLLFWKRVPSGGIIGCVVEDGAAKARLLGGLPPVYSAARILTVLDENGRPLLTPPGEGGRDWRRPLAAREVSELLPRWEAAAYPADPQALAAQVRSTRIFLGIAVLGLFAVIAMGGGLILQTLRSEIVLARQKTTFVTNVSHELKTPLTSIRMFSEMLKDGRQPDAGKQRAYLGLMVAETQRLTRLINNVLDFSRMEKGKRAYSKKRLDIGGLVKTVVESERARLEPQGFSVSFVSPASPVLVEADEEALRQAVVNLLSNAEKYSPVCKNVEVEVARADGSARIEVRDRGIGIPPAEAGKIFREFYRVDRSLEAPVRGSGLGLTIARRIVRDHGGDIAFRPREGGGSVFLITLPEADGR